MKYTAKDVCRMLNITRETLRYYEKVGIIHPEIDPVNKYRYYDDWDINYIYECKKYQSLGFSVKEVPITFEDRRAGYSKMRANIAYEAVMMVFRLWMRCGFRRSPRPRTGL